MLTATAGLALAVTAMLASTDARPAAAATLFPPPPPGSCLVSGTGVDRAIIGNDLAILTWQSDGNLALYATSSATPLWTTGTAGPRRQLCIGLDGSMRIEDRDTHAPLWGRLPTNGPAVKLDIDDDCDVSGLNPSGAVTWTIAGTCAGDAANTINEGWCADNSANATLLETEWARLVWQTDGNLVVYATGADDGEPIWASNTDFIGRKACFEDGGRLAVYDDGGGVLWSLGSLGRTADQWTLGLKDCDLQIDNWNSGLTTASRSATCPQPTESGVFTVNVNASKDTVVVENDDAELVLSPGGTVQLRGKDGDLYWTSNTAGTRLVFQSDGNLVTYLGNAATWATGTYGAVPGRKLSLTGCRLSVLSASGAVLWARGSATCNQSSLDFDGSSYGKSGNAILLRTDEAYLTWQSDGNLVLYTTSGTALWATNTSSVGNTLSFTNNFGVKVTDSSGLLRYSANVATTSPIQLTLSQCTLDIVGGGKTKTLNPGCLVSSHSYKNTDGNSTFGISVDNAMSVLNGTTKKALSAGGVDVKVLSFNVGLLDWSGSQSTTGGNPISAVTLAILGSSSSVNLAVEKEFFAKTKTYTVGVVPIVVSAGASGSLKLSTSIVDGALILTPFAELSASVSAGVGVASDVGGASAGIRGELSLLSLSLPVSLKLYNSGGWKYTVSGSVVGSTLSGALSLYAEAYVKVFGVKVSVDWSKKLFSWTGISLSKPLFSTTASF